MHSILCCNPYSCVADGKAGAGTIDFNTDGDGTPSIGVRERIVQEAHHDLNESCRIAQHRGWLQLLHLQSDTALNCQQPHGCCYIKGEQVQPYRLTVE